MNPPVLVDTSIWTDHLRVCDLGLAALIERDALLHHPYVTAELALVAGRHGKALRDALADLRAIVPLADDAMLAFAAKHGLPGDRIGFVGMHVIASAAHAGAHLWTRDRWLAAQAEPLGLGYAPG
jgi:predicted nucleic acid-binding protein